MKVLTKFFRLIDRDSDGVVTAEQIMEFISQLSSTRWIFFSTTVCAYFRYNDISNIMCQFGNVLWNLCTDLAVDLPRKTFCFWRNCSEKMLAMGMKSGRRISSELFKPRMYARINQNIFFYKSALFEWAKAWFYCNSVLCLIHFTGVLCGPGVWHFRWRWLWWVTLLLFECVQVNFQNNFRYQHGR